MLLKQTVEEKERARELAKINKEREKALRKLRKDSLKQLSKVLSIEKGLRNLSAIPDEEWELAIEES